MFEKNNNLIIGVCHFWFKSIRLKSFSLLTDFVNMYSTPSKIIFTSSSKIKPGGIEYLNKVKLEYPGLKNTDFSKFNELLNDRFISELVFLNNDVYKVGSLDVPLEMNLKFKSNKGTQIEFFNKSFYPVKYIGKHNEIEVLGFPYILKTNL